MIIGNVDIKAVNRVSGWCYDNERMDERLEVSVHCNGKEIARGKADRPRTDLEKLITKGNISFYIKFPPVLNPGIIEVFACNGEVERPLKFKGKIVLDKRDFEGATDLLPNEHVLKLYDALIPIGVNCELGWQLNKRFGKLDASLFQWCANQSRTMLPAIVENPDLIFSGEIEEDPQHNMWLCKITNIAFHGLKKPIELCGTDGRQDPDLISVEKRDTISRIAYLKKKFLETSISDLAKLYILACHPGFWNYQIEEESGSIGKIYGVIKRRFPNAHFLLIADKKLLPDSVRNMENSEFFIRYLNFFAPGDKAVFPEAMDTPGWDKIFTEFGQRMTIPIKKKLKFE